MAPHSRVEYEWIYLSIRLLCGLVTFDSALFGTQSMNRLLSAVRCTLQLATIDFLFFLQRLLKSRFMNE